MLSRNTRSFLSSTVVVWLFAIGACGPDPYPFTFRKPDDSTNMPDAGSSDAGLFNDGFTSNTPSDGCGKMPSPFPPTLPKSGDAWRQFGHDATHANRSSAIVGSAPHVLWKVEIQESAYALNPVVDEKGNLYAMTAEQLYAFSPNGELRWRTGDTPLGNLGASFRGVAIQQDGTVVASTGYGEVLGFSATGAQLFATKIASPSVAVKTPPTLDSNGTIYVAGIRFDGLSWLPSVHAIRANGEVAWSTVLDGQAREVSAIAIDSTNSLYVSLGFKDDFTTVYEGRVVKLNDKGEVLWSISNTYTPRAPAIAPSGDVWVPVIVDTKNNPGPNLYHYSSDGIQLAPVEILHSSPEGPPTVDLAGNVYLGMGAGLAAFNSSGKELWRIWGSQYPDPTFRISSRSAVDAEGMLIVSDDYGALRGIRNGCVIFGFPREGAPSTGMNDSVAIGPDGTIYAGSPSKYVYAFR